MIIDCHGHFTTTPPEHQDFRDAQLAWLAGGVGVRPAPVRVSDDRLRACVEPHQLRVLAERGGDYLLFSPKASGMEHHVTGPEVTVDWARAANDLVHRVAELYPDRLAAVCQLPQSPAGGTTELVAELRRCVEDLGFVGLNLNPDPSGGHWTAPRLTDPAWYPLYEVMVELDVPAMVHVSTSCNAATHTLGAHYLNADTTVFMQLLEGDLFERFPTLRLVIPHGGGAVPYHWGRFRGLAARQGLPDPASLLSNVAFDTAVYHQPGFDLLLKVVGPDHVLFASEMLGAVRGADPDSGIEWDDTLRYLEKSALAPNERETVVEHNVRRFYPRLDARLREQGR